VAKQSLPPVSPLRGLLEVTELLRAPRELPELLDAIARTIAESLGYDAVVVNLYRSAWDDFVVTAMHGSDAARAKLLGEARGVAEWERLLDARSHRRGAYVGPENALFVPMRHTDGHLLGVISVDRPVSRMHPEDDEIDVLVAIANHAAFAVQASQESAHSARHEVALERLLAVSSRLPAEPVADQILRAVCAGVRDALGFQNVLAALRDDQGRLDPRAAVGWELEDTQRTPVFLRDIEGLFDPVFEIEGCYLLPDEEAARRLTLARQPYVSEQNGRGPWAWQHHWLLVPLRDSLGEVIGVLWADEPEDRLLPPRDMLQALRLFANQAAAAIVTSAHVREMRFLADHDSLTRLLNRRAFVERLDAEVARATRYGHSFGLVVCDLDGFKELNDRFGHPAGDEALQHFARTLQSALRKGDDAFRIGGDEFALLLAEASEDDAREVVRRVGEQGKGIRVSFGVATCPAHARESQTLFRLADTALYEAKRSGGGLKFVA
jgi:diguanylate cyclase (GGDEF)-like protein